VHWLRVAALPAHRPGGQNGTVLFGLVLGLVVGLGLGMATAVLVSKLPAPFPRSEQVRNEAQDRADQARDPNWDPNTPLYGKRPARKAPAGFQPPLPMVAASAIVVLEPGDETEEEQDEDPYEYFVQTGDYGMEESALDLLARIRGTGARAAVVKRKGRFSVRIGPYSREGAEELKLDMDKAGCRCSLVRVEK